LHLLDDPAGPQVGQRALGGGDLEHGAAGEDARGHRPGLLLRLQPAEAAGGLPADHRGMQGCAVQPGKEQGVVNRVAVADVSAHQNNSP
jgi:hypothetical protein